MDKKLIKFDDTGTQEYKFCQYKSPILINDSYINEIVVSNKFTFGKQNLKYFIGYKDDKEIRPLCSFQKLVYIKDILISLNVCIL